MSVSRPPAGRSTVPAGAAPFSGSRSSTAAIASEQAAKSIAWLDSHISWESLLLTRAQAPTLERMRELVRLMGDPQEAYEVIHLTGTNGKGSTARMITSLLASKGLSVGMYTSPNLARVNERISWGAEPISDDDLVGLLGLLEALEQVCTSQPTRFELLTAAALRWFADVAVDVAVVEVGIGGLWDATNVVNAAVACVTNVGLDHVEILGPELGDIAREKAGIVKPGSTLVLGETAPDLAAIFRRAGAARVIERDKDFGCQVNRLAIGGRLLDIRTPYGLHEDLFLPLHGPHQGENAAVALAAVEAFFDAPVDDEVVREAFAAVRVPGRMEVAARDPLCVLDGAHNVDGARALAAALDEDFAVACGAGVVMVMGLLQGRNPVEMIQAIGVHRLSRVVACMPSSPRAMPAREVADAARSLGVACETATSVGEAVTAAVAMASPDGALVVTGSLYVVAEARQAILDAARRAAACSE